MKKFTPIVPKIMKRKREIIRILRMLIKEVIKAFREILRPSYCFINLKGLRILSILNILIVFKVPL